MTYVGGRLGGHPEGQGKKGSRHQLGHQRQGKLSCFITRCDVALMVDILTYSKYGRTLLKMFLNQVVEYHHLTP